jgi:hypothetical protein
VGLGCSRRLKNISGNSKSVGDGSQTKYEFEYGPVNKIEFSFATDDG